MRSTPIDLVLDALRAHGCEAKRAKEGYTSRCPAHEDRSPSLSIGIGADGERAIVKCHAGCAPERIIEAIGLTMSDLFPPREEQRPERRIVATYDYVDVLGKLLYQVVRYEPKDFRQRRPDGKGGWDWKRGDAKLVLYRADRVMAASDAGETIYVVEGEKDVHSIEKHNPDAVATTNAGGSGKWVPDYSRALMGAGRVVIIADRDAPGRKHAQDIAASLQEFNVPVELCEPAAGKDITEHLAQGLPLEQLDELHDELPDEPAPGAETAKEPRMLVESWPAFRDGSTEDITYLVAGLIPEGSLTFIAGAPKSGKTWIGIALGVAVVTGKPFLGRFTIPTAEPVLYLALEGHRSAIRARIGAIARGCGVSPDGEDLAALALTYRPIGLDLSDPAWGIEVASAVDQHAAKLVIVDVLRAAAPRLRESGEGATDFAHIRAHLAPLLARGVTIVLLHHFIKVGETSKARGIGERMSGSGALFGHADLVLGITGKDSENMRIELVGRDSATPDPFGVRLEGQGSAEFGGFGYRDTLRVRAVDDAPPAADVWDQAEVVAEWIAVQGRRVRIGELVSEFGISEKTIRRHRDDLQRNGISYIEDGRKSGYEAAMMTSRHYPGTPARRHQDSMLTDPGTPRHDPGTPGSLDDPGTPAPYVVGDGVDGHPAASPWYDPMEDD